MIATLAQWIRDVPDFPRKGIVFRDITPLLHDGPAFQDAIGQLSARWTSHPPELVAAIESRGLLFGAPLACALGAGIVPIRKPGKLPHKTHRASYALEYGHDALEIHQDAVEPGQRVLLIDDVLATGGTMCAAVELIEQCGGQIIGVEFLIELTALKGRARLSPHPVFSLIQY